MNIASVRQWITAHRANWRLAARITAAGSLTYIMATLFHLPQGYWAVFTAVIVTQTSVGSSLTTGIERLIGTIGGVAYSVLILTVMPHEEWPDLAVAIAVALFPLAFLAARRPSFRVAPVTAIILLLAPTRGVSAFVSAADRIFEIGLGTVAGVAVSLLIFPARAYALLAQSAADALTLYGRTITVLLDRAAGTGSPDVASVASRYAAIRAALSKVETLATDARRERDSRLAAGPDPDPLARTLRRLRSDLVIMDRAVVAALPPPVHAALAPVIAPVTRDVSAFLNAAAAALRARGGPPALDAVEAAVQAYASAVGAARRDGLMRTLSDEDVSRIFTLGFALDQLRLNFRDLADRITELAKL